MKKITFLRNSKNISFFLILVLAVVTAIYFYPVNIPIRQDSTSDKTKNNQVKIGTKNAEHLFDNDGIPFFRFEEDGIQYHPAAIATQALVYFEQATDKGNNLSYPTVREIEKFNHCIDWLIANIKEKANNIWVWEYYFDHTYNDISIKAPWTSAYAQAAGIQALLVSSRFNKNEEHLDLAKKAASALFVPIQAGGLLFQSGQDIWFEEIPDAHNPSHILNCQLRVLLVLKELADITEDVTIQSWFQKGVDSLYRWLPLYDTGYWLRYDLNPKKKELLFRIANPYGYPSHPLAIHKLTLRDPATNKEHVLQVGALHDSEGDQRIAGIHWTEPKKLDGKDVRFLVPTSIEYSPDQLTSAHTYFYFALPEAWQNNLRTSWHELIIEYYDDAVANLSVQMRSIAPGETFRDLRDGDLHLTGAHQWRRWIIPVRTTDLGHGVDQSDAEAHSQYLEKLAEFDKRFESWAIVAKGYANLNKKALLSPEKESKEAFIIPTQTTLLNTYSYDENGVMMQNIGEGQGTPMYQPMVIAKQILKDKNLPGAIAAIKWVLDDKHSLPNFSARIYHYPFDNTYNDIVTQAPWASSFGQAYILKGLIHAFDKEIADKSTLLKTYVEAEKAFQIDVKEGGVVSTDRSQYNFFEEVPQATHILNAELLSILELNHGARYFKFDDIYLKPGIQSLQHHLHRFDTGYWMRYDQNPKKEILLCFDWLEGNKSPFISDIFFENPQTSKFTAVNFGVDEFKGPTRLLGTDWLFSMKVDGKKVRGFVNGYKKRKHPIPGGTLHNVFLHLTLPNKNFIDYFDVPEHRLIIRYKDVAKGRFALKIRSISEGNVIQFVPLRNAHLITNGDQQWKERTFIIRPQELGWFKGEEYQKFEVDKLQLIANLTNKWFFYQYADRQRFFLDAYRNKEPVIVEQGIKDLREKVKIKNDEKIEKQKASVVFLEATDPFNPLSVFRMPITQRIKDLSDELVTGVDTDQKKIEAFLKYICQFRVGKNSDGTPEATITERQGACGLFTNTLLALSAAQGFPGRVISLLNYPKNNGHAVGEIFINGKWCLFDATFGAYYILKNDPNKTPLSYKEIIHAYNTEPSSVKLIYMIVRPGFEGFTGKEIFLKANPAGIIGPDKPFIFPLFMSLKSKNIIEKVNFNSKNQGANYMGAADLNQNQKWEISELEPGKEYIFEITTDYIGGDQDSSDNIFHLNANIENGNLLSPPSHEFDFRAHKHPIWEISFKADKPNVTLTLTHPYFGPKYRYIHMLKYELKEKVLNITGPL